jgi:hypothetical protein
VVPNRELSHQQAVRQPDRHGARIRASCRPPAARAGRTVSTPLTAASQPRGGRAPSPARAPAGSRGCRAEPSVGQVRAGRRVGEAVRRRCLPPPAALPRRVPSTSPRVSSRSGPSHRRAGGVEARQVRRTPTARWGAAWSSARPACTDARILSLRQQHEQMDTGEPTRARAVSSHEGRTVRAARARGKPAALMVPAPHASVRRMNDAPLVRL